MTTIAYRNRVIAADTQVVSGKPAIHDGGDEAEAFVVLPDGTIWLREGYHRFPLNAEHYASGSGEAVALGAMFAGASPETAIRAAIKHDTGTGGEVQTFHLSGVQ